MTGWTPLSERESGAADVLYDGIPAHMHRPILDWLGYWATDAILTPVALRSRVPYHCVYPDKSFYRNEAILKGTLTLTNPEAALLNVVEGILHARLHEEERPGMRGVGARCSEALAEILDLGGSKWHVVGDHLEARVNDSVREAVLRAQVDSAAASAAAHLRDAWLACYGRNANPGKAYSDAIKAVEAAAAPIVSPKDLKATLGTMLGHMKANPNLWRFAIALADIAPVITAMSTLWDGQTDRHAGNAPTVPIAQTAAEAAVLQAATLVHWFATGAVTRR